MDFPRKYFMLSEITARSLLSSPEVKSNSQPSAFLFSLHPLSFGLKHRPAGLGIQILSQLQRASSAINLGVEGGSETLSGH
jgi:hypothetical protein